MALTQRQIGLGLGSTGVALAVLLSVLWLNDHRSRSSQAAKASSMPGPSDRAASAPSTEAPPSILLAQGPLAEVVPPNFRSLKPASQAANPAAPLDAPPAPPPVASKAKANDPPKAPQMDATRLRRVMDQGVFAYAKSSSQEGQTKGAALIYLSAIGGYRPARDLVAHNYPLSKAVRTVVPAEDAMRFAVVGFANPTSGQEETVRIFRAMVQHYAESNALGEFSQLLLEALRDDRRLHFNHALDKITDVLERIPGSCGALASALSETLRPIQGDGTCSASVIDALVEYLTKTRPSTRETDLRSRALELLTEMDLKR